MGAYQVSAALSLALPATAVVAAAGPPAVFNHARPASPHAGGVRVRVALDERMFYRPAGSSVVLERVLNGRHRVSEFAARAAAQGTQWRAARISMEAGLSLIRRAARTACRYGHCSVASKTADAAGAAVAQAGAGGTPATAPAHATPPAARTRMR